MIATVGTVVPHFAQICNIWFLYAWRGAFPWLSDDYVNDWITWSANSAYYWVDVLEAANVTLPISPDQLAATKEFTGSLMNIHAMTDFFGILIAAFATTGLFGLNYMDLTNQL